MLKLAILGGGGVRMPAFVRAVISGEDNIFDANKPFRAGPATPRDDR